jgi:hypothetical protein
VSVFGEPDGLCALGVGGVDCDRSRPESELFHELSLVEFPLEGAGLVALPADVPLLDAPALWALSLELGPLLLDPLMGGVDGDVFSCSFSSAISAFWLSVSVIGLPDELNRVGGLRPPLARGNGLRRRRRGFFWVTNRIGPDRCHRRCVGGSPPSSAGRRLRGLVQPDGLRIGPTLM